MRKLAFVMAAAAVAAAVISSLTSASPDQGRALLVENREQIVKLTPPSTPQAGGTGFQLRAPSGKVYTVSNGHVCEAAEDGYMHAHRAGQARPLKLKVIEISEETDLCLLEGLPGASGLRLADEMKEALPLYVLGHPGLSPLTVSEGYATQRLNVKLAEYDREPEQCKGPTRAMETVPGPWGMLVRMCVRTVAAWDTDAVIKPGSSGSPVLQEDGVAGVIFAGHGMTSFGAMVPLEDVRKFIEIY